MRRRLEVFVFTFGFWLGFGWLARLVFLAFHHARAGTLTGAELAMTFGAGLRLDLSAAAYLTLIPTLLLALSAFRPAIPAARVGAWVWTGAVAILGALLVAIDLETFRHWDRRIDAMLLTYLGTPREAWASAGGSPRLLLGAIALALGAGALLGYRRTVARAWTRLEPIRPVQAIPLLLLIGPLFLAGRGGWQEIALTQSSGYFSSKPFANFAAQNPLWGFFDSIGRRLDDSVNHFRSMDPAAALEIVATARAPVAATVAPPVSVRRPNILVIVWESGAAPAFASTGGLPGVTPRFDSLRREGILFRNMYAAGDRTDKGVTAVLSGFPGLPTGSIMKVPAKARSLPMLSADLRAAGYRTSFYYGGELEFASMQAYLYEAGFDRIVGKGDFPRESWNSKWGAHDGVVAGRVLRELSNRTGPEPFFAVWLTLSSHEPFETPTPPRFPGSGWRDRYLSSMAYTDGVIGALVDSARTRDWWDHTLIVVVSDHGRRVAERDPAFRDAEALFHIPMLWLGGALTARDSVVTTIASQLDVAPTLVDLTGAADPERYRWGRSLLRPTTIPYAFYAFEQGFGLVTDRGYLVYDHRARSFPTRVGLAAEPEERLGRALFQLTYQSYLDLGRTRAEPPRPAN